MINLMLLLAFIYPMGIAGTGYFGQPPLRVMSAANVTVYSPTNVDTSIANGYLWEFERLYSHYDSLLAVGHGNRLRIRLCHDKYDFAQLTGVNSIFSPFWKDGTLYVIALDDINTPGYLTKLATGAILGLLDSVRRNGAPAWLVYSTAVYESGEYEGLTPPPFENVRYFSDLEEKIQSAVSATNLSDLLFYLGNTGKFFDMKLGVGSLSRLLHEFSHPIGLSNAVAAAFHIGVPELEREWRSYISNLVTN